jgi:hypothetical protein
VKYVDDISVGIFCLREFMFVSPPTLPFPFSQEKKIVFVHIPCLYFPYTKGSIELQKHIDHYMEFY